MLSVTLFSPLQTADMYTHTTRCWNMGSHIGACEHWKIITDSPILEPLTFLLVSVLISLSRLTFLWSFLPSRPVGGTVFSLKLVGCLIISIFSLIKKMNQCYVLRGKNSAHFHLAGPDNICVFSHALGESLAVFISINNDVHVCVCVCLLLSTLRTCVLWKHTWHLRKTLANSFTSGL